MRMTRPIGMSWLVGLALVLAAAPARADQVWTVTLDTSNLAKDYTGPFGIDFELIGGNGNTITLSGFSFGAGGSAGPGGALLTGEASGDLGGTVALYDNASTVFFSDFNQQFTPGGTLTFTVDSTLAAAPAGGFPDSFSMVIFYGYDPAHGYDPLSGAGGTLIPTTDPTGADTLVTVDVNGPGDTTAVGYPSANGDVPVVVATAAVPEPPGGALMLLGLMALAGPCARRGLSAR